MDTIDIHRLLIVDDDHYRICTTGYNCKKIVSISGSQMQKISLNYLEQRKYLSLTPVQKSWEQVCLNNTYSILTMALSAKAKSSYTVNSTYDKEQDIDIKYIVVSFVTCRMRKAEFGKQEWLAYL